jgi:hypothetical protein
MERPQRLSNTINCNFQYPSGGAFPGEEQVPEQHLLPSGNFYGSLPDYEVGRPHHIPPSCLYQERAAIAHMQNQAASGYMQKARMMHHPKSQALHHPQSQAASGPVKPRDLLDLKEKFDRFDKQCVLEHQDAVVQAEMCDLLRRLQNNVDRQTAQPQPKLGLELSSCRVPNKPPSMKAMPYRAMEDYRSVEEPQQFKQDAQMRYPMPYAGNDQACRVPYRPPGMKAMPYPTMEDYRSLEEPQQFKQDAQMRYSKPYVGNELKYNARNPELQPSQHRFAGSYQETRQEASGVQAIEIYEGPDIFAEDIFDDDFEEEEQIEDLEMLRAYQGPQQPPPGLVYNPHDSGLQTYQDNERTTLMISNIPTRCSQGRLLEKWPADGSYDFLYLPCRFGEHKNFGYAFVNFVSHESAKDFYVVWQGKTLGVKSAGNKPLVITWASIQGRDKNIKHSLNRKIKRIRNPQFQPAIFEGTVRVDFNEYIDMMSRLERDF